MPSLAISNPKRVSVIDVENNGERISPHNHDQNFAMHFGVYEFAAKRVKGKSVADIGSGSGYGSHFLAQTSAAIVHGYEFSQVAIDFSDETYAAPNLKYLQANFDQPVAGKQKYDVVFSSNVFEHLIDVRQAICNVIDMMNPDGEFILAVPCIIDSRGLRDERNNIYHFANLSVRFWLRTLRRCFKNVTIFAQAVHCTNEAYGRLSLEEQKRKDKSFSTFVELIRDPAFQDKDEFNFDYANIVYVCHDPTGTVELASFSECPVSSIRKLILDTDPPAGWTPILNSGDCVVQDLPVKGWVGDIQFYLGDCNQKNGGMAEIELRTSDPNGCLAVKQMIFDLTKLNFNAPTMVYWPLCREPLFVPDNGCLTMSIRSHAYPGSKFNVMLGQPTSQEERPFWIQVFGVIEPIPGR